VSDGLEERITELEHENLNLTIGNKAKEQVIGQMVEERKEMISQLTNSSHMVGVLETQLKALEAPRHMPQENEQSTGGGSSPQVTETDRAVEYEDTSGEGSQ